MMTKRPLPLYRKVILAILLSSLIVLSYLLGAATPGQSPSQTPCLDMTPAPSPTPEISPSAEASAEEVEEKEEPYTFMGEEVVERSFKLTPGMHDMSFPLSVTESVKGFYGAFRIFYQGEWRNVTLPPPVLRPVLGYRLYNRVPLEVKLSCVINTSSLSICTLVKGSNFIGNPYDERLVWRDTLVYARGRMMSVSEAAQSSVIERDVKYYNGGKGKAIKPEGWLEPWKGYWIKAGEPCFLIFLNPIKYRYKDKISLSIAAYPPQIQADNRSVAEIEISATDSDGQPLSDYPVDLATSCGNVFPERLTLSEGKARASFRTHVMRKDLIAATCGNTVTAVPIEITLPKKVTETSWKPSEKLVGAAFEPKPEGRFGINGFHEMKLDAFTSEGNVEYIDWEASLMGNGGISYNRTIAGKGGPFAWKYMELKRGEYSFSMADTFMRQIQKSGVNLVVVLSTSNTNFRTKRVLYKQKDFTKPHDPKAFEEYVEAVVERYDGDGFRDMPGLRYPVKYWEIGNEPEAPFEYNGKNFLEVLRSGFRAVKKADPGSRVLMCATNIGAMGPSPRDRIVMRFWTDVLEGGGMDCFDILSVHSPIEIDLTRTTGLSDFWRERLQQAGKKAWITEYGFYTGVVEMEDLLDPGCKNVFVGGNEAETSANFMKSTAIYFASGYEKVFWTFFYAKEMDWMEHAALVKNDGKPRPVYYTQKLLASKLDGFTSAREVSCGLYQFTVKGKSVYIAWGDGYLPLTGKVKVTTIYGYSEVSDASQVYLNSYPIIIEPVGSH
jgi:hypothetical protein